MNGNYVKTKIGITRILAIIFQVISVGLFNSFTVKGVPWDALPNKYYVCFALLLVVQVCLVAFYFLSLAYDNYNSRRIPVLASNVVCIILNLAAGGVYFDLANDLNKPFASLFWNVGNVIACGVFSYISAVFVVLNSVLWFLQRYN